MQAAKRKSWLGELWRPLAALLLWVLGMVPLIAAPPLPSLAETRIGGLTTYPADFIQAPSLLTIESHRACAPPLYDLASGCSVAANRGAALTDDVARGLAPQGMGARFGSDAKLLDHFNRHGGDFGHTTAAGYQAAADRFMMSNRGAGILEKVRPNGDVVRFNPATNEFGVSSKDGVLRTYYRPDPAVHGKPTNLDYFNGQ
jgi:hypothetical protein